MTITFTSVINFCFAQQGSNQSVTLLSYVTRLAIGAYATIIAERYVDSDNPDVANPVHFSIPSVESHLANISLIRNLAGPTPVNGDIFFDATNDSQGMMMTGAWPNDAIQGYYIDLCDPTRTQADPHVYISSLATDERISFVSTGNFLGATQPSKGPDPMGLDSPIGGKHVYDIAEGVRVSDDCQAGDVVVISSKEDMLFVKTKKAFDTRVAGVISASPKLLMGNGPETKPLALAGIVECNVTAENGPIKQGDLLVCASLAGYAMRADAEEVSPGMILGSALDVLDSGKGKIYILINQ